MDKETKILAKRMVAKTVKEAELLFDDTYTDPKLFNDEIDRAASRRWFVMGWLSYSMRE